ncbi:hypothetical protein [Crinalium epipsammum]|uniref:hypothetical protein n=1 Tax=Crinalium epipsammum TaxID=241425 RepID=UPI0002F6203D|nr:hypothetical protein [Crinalium epipsammum]
MWIKTIAIAHPPSFEFGLKERSHPVYTATSLIRVKTADHNPLRVVVGYFCCNEQFFKVC